MGVWGLAVWLVVLAAPAVAADGTRWLSGLLRGALEDEPCELGREVEGGHAEAAAADTVVAVQKRRWEDALGGAEAAQSWVRARLVGWPDRLVVDPGGLPADDPGFLRRLANGVG